MLGDPNRAPAFTLFPTGARDRVAITTSDGSLTYGELDERVSEVAASLGSARRLVLLGAANRVEPLVTYLAALRAGHPVLLVADDDPAAAARLTEAYDPDVVVGGATDWALDERRLVSAHDLHPDLALLLSTSGSTGSAKLVRLSARNLEANAASIVEYLRLTPDDRALTTLPLQYCYGLSVIHSHLQCGASLALTSLSVVDPCLWDLFRTTEATSLAGVPYTFELLDRVGFEAMDLPSLRYVTQAGGRLAPEVIRRYAELGRRRGWELFVMYGQTEATARMAYLPPDLATRHPQAIGVAIPGGEFTLEPVDGLDRDDGAGELVYRGPNVMLGYASEPADLALGATVDALHTGDLARRTDEGLYEIVGRRSRFLKVFGLRIALDELEAQLAALGVTALCTGSDERLVVAVEGAADRTAIDAVTAQVGLPRSRVVVVELDEPPRLSNGKPDYATVLRRAEAGPEVFLPADGAAAGSGSAVPVGSGPDDDVRLAVRRAFVDALGVEPRDHDTFVDLGGDSLSYVELSIALEELLGALPPTWHLMPISELVPQRPRSRWLARVETTVALRAVAIVLVVTTHTLFLDLPGGAHTLLGIAGYNFARFQVRARSRLPALARIAVPSALWIGLAAAIGDQYQWHHATFLNAQFGPPESPWGYWFVEALVQILIPLAVLFSIPAVRRLEQRHPFGLPLAVTAGGLAIRFDVIDPPPASELTLRPHEAFFIFALGWLAARSTTPVRRLLVSGLVLASVPGFFDLAQRQWLVTCGLLLVLWVPAVVVPRPLNRVCGALAGGSLAIYLTHWQVFPPLLRAFGPLEATVGSIVVGLLAWVALQRATELVTRLARPSASPASPPVPEVGPELAPSSRPS